MVVLLWFVPLVVLYASGSRLVGTPDADGLGEEAGLPVAGGSVDRLVRRQRFRDRIAGVVGIGAAAALLLIPLSGAEVGFALEVLVVATFVESGSGVLLLLEPGVRSFHRSWRSPWARGLRDHLPMPERIGVRVLGLTALPVAVAVLGLRGGAPPAWIGIVITIAVLATAAALLVEVAGRLAVRPPPATDLDAAWNDWFVVQSLGAAARTAIWGGCATALALCALPATRPGPPRLLSASGLLGIALDVLGLALVVVLQRREERQRRTLQRLWPALVRGPGAVDAGTGRGVPAAEHLGPDRARS